MVELTMNYTAAESNENAKKDKSLRKKGITRGWNLKGIQTNQQQQTEGTNKQLQQQQQEKEDILVPVVNGEEGSRCNIIDRSQAIRKQSYSKDDKGIEQEVLTIDDNEDKTDFPKFSKDELVLGKVLGKGSFGTVREVLGINLDSDSLDNITTSSLKKNNNKSKNRPSLIRSSLKLSLLSRRPDNNPKDSTLSHTRRNDDKKSKPFNKNGTNNNNPSSDEDFNNSFSIHSFNYNEGDYDGEDVLEQRHRQFIAEHCIRRNNHHKGHARYAIKSISDDLMDHDDDLLGQGIQDIATETKYLSKLLHPNIIKMRALSNAKPFVAPTRYFIVMDRLYDTLDCRLKTWSKQIQRGRIINTSLMRKKKMLLVDERLMHACGLSSALSYLHSNKIIHRDIKPTNIGFDIRGDIKIFDFGFATKLDERLIVAAAAKQTEDGGDNGSGNEEQQQPMLFDLSGTTGTIRYMAPEVARGEPYNETADIYSFSLVLWQMLSLQRPYDTFKSANDFRCKVHFPSTSGGERPTINHDWPSQVQTLLIKGWSDKISDRLSMINVHGILKEELVALRDGDDTGTEMQDPNKRRSTFVFRRSQSGYVQSNNGEN